MPRAKPQPLASQAFYPVPAANLLGELGLASKGEVMKLHVLGMAQQDAKPGSKMAQKQALHYLLQQFPANRLVI